MFQGGKKKPRSRDPHQVNSRYESRMITCTNYKNFHFFFHYVDLLKFCTKTNLGWKEILRKENERNIQPYFYRLECILFIMLKTDKKASLQKNIHFM